ncbi:hypothetical protein BGY98DRAFT_932566 [Russula aff. rugulosa BPL654]|nr:hypothetical protein BGY98DRAFT_932566 [Russula aff. rugulosa BPL654]
MSREKNGIRVRFANPGSDTVELTPWLEDSRSTNSEDKSDCSGFVTGAVFIEKRRRRNAPPRATTDRHFRLQRFSFCLDGKQPLGVLFVFYAVRSSIDTGGTSPTYQQWQYTVEVSKNLQRRVTRELEVQVTLTMRTARVTLTFNKRVKRKKKGGPRHEIPRTSGELPYLSLRPSSTEGGTGGREYDNTKNHITRRSARRLVEFYGILHESKAFRIGGGGDGEVEDGEGSNRST